MVKLVSLLHGEAILVDYQDYPYEVSMSSMFNPPHPGLTLRDDVLPGLNLQVSEAGVQLGVDRTTLSKVLNGRAAITPTMALRIERWLGRDHGGAAEVWLAQQAAYDLWQARQAVKATKALSTVKALKLRLA
jgi:addiction module HigA family antidote